MVEHWSIGLHSGLTAWAARGGEITKILQKKRVYPVGGGSGYPGAGAWGVRVGESPRKNIIKNEVGVWEYGVDGGSCVFASLVLRDGVV